MEHDDWPIGRLIERELASLRLFAVCKEYQPTEDVRAVVKKDAWMTWKMVIKDAILLDSQCFALREPEWRRVLEEALKLLGVGGRGRGWGVAVLSQKGQREMELSPHIQFVTPLWKRMPNDHGSRVASFERARLRLAPLYAAMTELAR